MVPLNYNFISTCMAKHNILAKVSYGNNNFHEANVEFLQDKTWHFHKTCSTRNGVGFSAFGTRENHSNCL